MSSFDYLPLSLQFQVLELVLPILAAIAAESHMTIDKSHQPSLYLHGGLLVLGLRHCCWVCTTINESCQLSLYPHGRHVGIGFEMLLLDSRHWHWMRTASHVFIPMIDVLALGLRCWVQTCWHWVQVWVIGIEFYISSLGSDCGSALDLVEPALFTSVNHPGPPLRAINSRVNAGLRGMAKICLKIK